MEIKTVGDFRKAVRMGPYAWPGGYAIYLVTTDAGVLCHDCMKSETRNILESLVNKSNDGWEPFAVQCSQNDEETVTCDHCNAILFEVEEETNG